MSHTPIASDDLPLGLQPRTVFVTGKGGVGKSTVAASLALAWRDAGVRTLLVELEGQSSAAALINSQAEVGYEPVPLATGLSAMRIDSESSLREYARMRLKVKMFADRLVGNAIIEQFAQAAPGLSELLVLGKIWAMAREVDSRKRPQWEAIVVDAPATGHGLGLLNMAGRVARMFPVGPVSTEAKAVDVFVRDPKQTGIVLVALPEELPVSETIELHEQLAEQGVAVAATVLNSLLVDRFSPDDAAHARALVSVSTIPGSDEPLDPAVRAALLIAVDERIRCAEQARERARLEKAIGEVSVLPFMFTSELTRDHISSLARWLAPPGQERLRQQLAGAADGPAEAAAVAIPVASEGAAS